MPSARSLRLRFQSAISATALITAWARGWSLVSSSRMASGSLPVACATSSRNDSADELVVARADAAPGMHAHAAMLAHRFGLHVRDAVERLLEAAPADEVLAAGGL